MVLPPTPQTSKVFLDSSVLYAANYSTHGRAFDLINAGLAERLPLALSQVVLMETERNISAQAPHARAAFRAVAELLSPYLVTPTAQAVIEAAAIVHPKDAPIVAAAVAAGAQFLATYDRRHLLCDEERNRIADTYGITAVTPDEILTLLLRQP